MKRFYKLVSVAPGAGGFEIHLDGKPVRTQSREILASPTKALAEEIMKEWMAQIDVIDPETMPLTQILTTATERGGHNRETIEQEVLGYLNTDLLLYRTVEPEAVARLQNDVWGRWTDWFAAESGVKLLTTSGLTALEQPRAAHDYMVKIVKGADMWVFTAIQMVTAISGSIILALAFTRGAATAEDVFHAAQLEELYRNELYNESFYGQAPHQEKAHAGIRRDLIALRVFLNSI
jgi:chaperone required for assembly of F1-ATPase